MNTSIVIPTKNNIDTIDKCLSSLMPYYEQGYIREIIVVDGHSNDGTLDVLKDYPVKLLFEKEKGIGMAYELGWRSAQGELVILFDSDVYLTEGFFPRIHEMLSDDVGWISCHPKGVVSNRLTRAQAEDWDRSSPMLAFSSSWFRCLYSRINTGGHQEPLCGGPCMVVRRGCLEAVNGLQGLSPGTLGREGACLGDICLSQRIAGKGWKTIWWHDAPVYHHPRATLRGLLKQYHGYGKTMAYMHLEDEFRKSYPWYGKVISIVARLASPVLGITLAIRYRNPLQLIVYPLPRYAVAAGYVVGWIHAKRAA